jgi:hypothetical protein
MFFDTFTVSGALITLVTAGVSVFLIIRKPQSGDQD